MTAPFTLHPELVWLDGRFRPGQGVRVDASGRISAVQQAEAEDPGIVALPRRALLPGFVNAHSHAFQRLIRGRTQCRAGGDGTRADFWSWREAMFGAALELSAEDVFDVARWCFLEMMRTGVTSVGEFHYLHHQPDGRPYADPNELAHRVVAAAESVGMRIVLLNVCYAAGGIGRGLGEDQRRFRVESPQRYLRRTEALLGSVGPSALATVGLAPHSIRAVPREWLAELHAFAAARELPLHMHVAEQVAEVEAAVAEYGLRPVELLAEEGVLDERFTAIHATHLTDREIELLARSRASVCACPTTERDLGDGFLRGLDLLDAGVSVCLGTDSHTSLDFLAEMRLVEYHERLRRQARVVIARDDGAGNVSVAPPLLDMATVAGAGALALEAGAITPGYHADMIAVDLDHPSLLGASPDTLGAVLTLSATPEVVSDVWVGGVRRLEGGRHEIEPAAAEAFRRVAERI